MMSNPQTIAASPVRDFGIRAWVWMIHHKKTSFLLVFAAVCTISQLVLISPAWGSTVYGLPTEDLEDSHGVPVSRYTNLPFDEGGVTSPVRAGRYMIASLLWTLYSFPVIAMIVMTDWILSFGWLEWIAAPVTALISAIDSVLSGMGIVVVGALVAALVVAIGILRGRMGRSMGELGIVIVMFGVIATSIASPDEWITGDDGWINQSADFGSGIADEMTSGEGGGDETSGDSIVSGELIDMVLREPMLSMSFGSNLANLDNCEDVWNDNASDPENSTDDLRDEVTSCHDAAEGANETSDFIFIGFFIMGGVTAVGVLFLLGVALVFLIKEVVMAFFGAVNTVVKSYFALFPGGARYAFFNALMQTIVSVVMVGVYVWAMMAYLWVIDLISAFLPALMGPAALLFGVVVIVMAITFIMMKIQGKKVGESIARALGRGGLSGSEGQQGKPSRLGSASRHAGQSARNAYQRTRMMRAATTATRVGTAAATGGTSAAVAGSMAAKRVGTNLAAKQATKSAMMNATKPLASNPAAAKGGHRAGQSARGSVGKPGKFNATRSAGATSAAATPTVASSGQGFSTTAPTMGVNEAPAGPVSNLPPAGATRSGLSNGQVEAGAAAMGPKPELERARPHQGPGGGHFQPASSATTGTSDSPAARPTTLPPGRYGNVWVHKDGTATTMLEGQAESAPSKSKLDKAWVVASPDVPTARSQRAGWATPGGGVRQTGPRTGAPRQPQGTPATSTKTKGTRQSPRVAERTSLPVEQPASQSAAKGKAADRRRASTEKLQTAQRQREQAVQQRAGQSAQGPPRQQQASTNGRTPQATDTPSQQKSEKQTPQSRVRRAIDEQRGA